MRYIYLYYDSGGEGAFDMKHRKIHEREKAILSCDLYSDDCDPRLRFGTQFSPSTTILHDDKQ